MLVQLVVCEFSRLRSGLQIIIRVVYLAFSENETFMCQNWMWLISCNLWDEMVRKYFLLRNKLHYRKVRAE